MIDRLGQLRGKRKFLVAIFTLAGGFVLALIGRLTGAEYVTLGGLVMGLYGGAAAATAAVTQTDNRGDG